MALAAELHDLVERHEGAIARDLEADASAALILVEAFERIEGRNLTEVSAR